MPECEKETTAEHPGPLWCREADRDCCLSAEAPASVSDSGNSDEERACSCENINRDYGTQAESVAPGIQEDSSDSSQSSSEEESAAPSCGKAQEETDRAQDLICEAQQRAEGAEREVQEEELSLVRADEDQHMELSDLAAGDMGIAQSVDTPECSDLKSGSQGEESRESESESEVGNGNSSFLEQEEMEGIKEQSENDEQELNRADSQSEGLFISADTIHPLDDEHEVNASNYELETKEQERTIKDNPEAQEEDTPDISCHEQFDITCQHREESDTTPEGTCQRNDAVDAELQMLLDADTNLCSSGFDLDDASSVTLDTISQSTTHSPEPEPEATTRESDLTIISETTAGSQSEGQTLECSTDVSLAALGLEPESSTPSSKDALQPEETEWVSANMVQTVSASAPQEFSQQNSLTCECEHTQTSEVTVDREDTISLENKSQTEEILLKHEDGPQTNNVFPVKNSEVSDQENQAASPKSLVLKETVELRSLEGSLSIIKEDVQPSLDCSESLLCNFSTTRPADIVEGFFSLHEQSRLRSEDSTKPEGVDTDSAATEWTGAKDTQEGEHEENVDGHQGPQEGEINFHCTP